MLRTRHRDKCAILDLYHGMWRIIRCKAATGTRKTASRLVVQEINWVLGCELTDRGELLKMIITADNGDCELIQEKE